MVYIESFESDILLNEDFLRTPAIAAAVSNVVNDSRSVVDDDELKKEKKKTKCKYKNYKLSKLVNRQNINMSKLKHTNLPAQINNDCPHREDQIQ